MVMLGIKTLCLSEVKILWSRCFIFLENQSLEFCPFPFSTDKWLNIPRASLPNIIAVKTFDQTSKASHEWSFLNCFISVDQFSLCFYNSILMSSVYLCLTFLAHIHELYAKWIATIAWKHYSFNFRWSFFFYSNTVVIRNYWNMNNEYLEY